MPYWGFVLRDRCGIQFPIVADLSIILPIYNAFDWIEDKIYFLRSYLDGLDLEAEIIAVDDGSKDGTAEKLKKIPSVKAIFLPINIGKLGAIAEGMKAASGSCKIFTDCDLPYDLSAIRTISNLILERDFHIVTGDRTISQSCSTKKRSNTRSATSRVFSFLVRILLTGGLFDTQCGIKGFRSDVADVLFALLKEKRFAGDVELLYLALKYNLEVKRIPVNLVNEGRSSVNLLSDSANMFWSLVKIPIRWRCGYYRSDALSDIYFHSLQ